MSYPQYQENIIFPARHFDESRGTFPWQYRNDDPTPTVLGCIDHTEICDSHGKKCWAPPSFFTPRAAFQWVREITTANQDLSLALLMGSLAGSGVCSALSGGSLETSINTYDFETASRCHFQSCSTLPVDQWKTEARRWFEASLARIQINVLDITRGTSNLGHADHDGIPPSLRGICQMGKFKSVAWRNEISNLAAIDEDEEEEEEEEKETEDDDDDNVQVFDSDDEDEEEEKKEEDDDEVKYVPETPLTCR
ncbi:hypothetical protein MMC12_005632 [Toensbergia leucococca]|nr:hypothetical protein [Toensbergia leucococca]